MIHFQIHDTSSIIKSHDLSFLISNLVHHKIINKTFGIYTLENHTKCDVFLTPSIYINPYKITSLELIP